MTITHKLGKKPARIHPQALKFAKYARMLPAPPENCGYADKVPSFPMYGNDTLGDCVEAAMGHMEQRWTTYAGKPWTPVLEDIISAYSAITGYNPADPSTDQGTDPVQAVDWWKNTGLAGRKIVASLLVNPKNHTEVKQAVNLYGGLFTGLELPLGAQNPIQGVNGFPCWAVGGPLSSDQWAPGGWVGHMVDLWGYGVDKDGNSGTMIVTWGQLFGMTWDFIDAYSDVMFAIVTQDWIEADGKSPSGFDIATLQADLALLQ